MKDFPPLVELKCLIEYDISEVLERLKRPNVFTGERLNDSEIQSELQNELEPKIKLQTEIDLNSITQDFRELAKTNQFQNHAISLQETIDEIKELENYNNFSFLHQYINKIEKHIKRLSGKTVDLKTSNSQPTSSNYSFNLRLPEDCKNDIQDNAALAKLLYNSLIHNQIIEGEETDFVNGFINSNVENRIKWILKIKNNKHTSKISIFYLISLLIDQDLIAKKKDYRNHVRYVFCDFNGKELEDLRISNILEEDFSRIFDKDKMDTAFQDFLSKLN